MLFNVFICPKKTPYELGGWESETMASKMHTYQSRNLCNTPSWFQIFLMAQFCHTRKNKG